MSDKSDKPDKSLKDKAIDIKGTEYVLVADRILYFNEQYILGAITTELVTDPESDLVVVKATVTPTVEQPQRYFTGYSQAIKGDGPVNKTAALENAETSAVGRALAMMGIGVIESVASADEMTKATSSQGERSKFASPKQVNWMRKEARFVIGDSDDEDVDIWLEQNIGAQPAKLAGKDTARAVDKIRQIGQDYKQQATIANQALDKAGLTLTPEDEQKLADGTLLDGVDY